MDSQLALRTCGECGCEFCLTATAQQVSPHNWNLVFECPNCWSTWTRVVDDEAFETIERQLDDDVRLIAAQLSAVRRYEMHADVKRLVAALRADAILPMDF